jgi:hypothetical protein
LILPLPTHYPLIPSFGFMDPPPHLFLEFHRSIYGGTPRQMRRDLSCPSPPAHMSPSPATLVGPPHCLAPSQHTPELLEPRRTSWVAPNFSVKFDWDAYDTRLECSKKFFFAHINSIATVQDALLARIAGCAATCAEDKCCHHEFNKRTATREKAQAGKADKRRHHEALERAAREQRTVVASTILLWIPHRRLQIRLTRTTAQWQQREAALARQQYKQECCTRTVMAEERQQQASATREIALANEANKQRCHEAAKCAAALAEMTLAKE